MPVTVEHAKGIKDAHIKHVETQARNVAKNRGLSDSDADVLAKSAGSKDWLVVFRDRYSMHMAGEDARCASLALDLPTATASDGKTLLLSIDARDWNDALAVLEGHGYSVAATDAPVPVKDDPAKEPTKELAAAA